MSYIPVSIESVLSIKNEWEMFILSCLFKWLDLITSSKYWDFFCVWKFLWKQFFTHKVTSVPALHLNWNNFKSDANSACSISFRYVRPGVEVRSVHRGWTQRVLAAGAGVHPPAGWAEGGLLGGHRPNHQPATHGDVRWQGQPVSVLELLVIISSWMRQVSTD